MAISLIPPTCYSAWSSAGGASGAWAALPSARAALAADLALLAAVWAALAMALLRLAMIDCPRQMSDKLIMIASNVPFLNAINAAPPRHGASRDKSFHTRSIFTAILVAPT
jgi:hypothetical protein